MGGCIPPSPTDLRPWFVHVQRKDDGHIARRVLRRELSGKRKQRMPKRRYMDAVREDMAVVEVMEEDAEDVIKCRWKT